MSTEGAVTRSLLIGTFLLLTPATSRAAQVQFLPQAEVTFYRDGNVAKTGDKISDEVTEVGIDLALSVTGPGTSFRFSYAPYRELFNELSYLDNTGHRVSAALSREISRRSTFGLGLDASRTERQGFRFDAPQDPTSLVPRSTQERASFELNGRVGVARRSFVDWSTEASLVRYEQSATVVLRDSDAFGASVGWGQRISEQTEMGVRAGAGRIRFAELPDTDTQSLGFFVARQFSRNLTGAVDVGVVRSETLSESTTDPGFELSLTRAAEGISSLTVGVSQEVSSGTGASRATLDRGAYVTWRTRRSPRVEASVGATYWRREDLSEAAGIGTGTELETFETSESIAWTPGRGTYALGAFHAYRNQDDIGGTSSFLDTDYHSGGVFFRWTRRGR